MKVASNAVWLVGCRLAANLLNLVLFVAISRYFGPAGIGTYSYAFAVAGFVYVIGSLGLDEYGIREYSRLDTSQRQPFLAKLLGAQCCMLIAAAAGVGVYLLLAHMSWTTTFIIASLALYQLGYSLARTLFIPAVANQAVAELALAELTCRGGAFVLAAAAIALGTPLPAAMAVFCLFGVCLAALGLRSAARHAGRIKVAISRADVVAKVRAVWSFAAAEILGQVFVRISLIVLTFQFGEEVAGTYATGLKFVEVACMPVLFLGIAAYPRLSQLAVRDSAAFARTAENFWAVTVVFSGLTVWALYFILPLGLVPLLGPRFAGSEPVLQGMIVLAVMQLLEIVLVRLSLAADLHVTRFNILAAGTLFCVVINFWLIPKYAVTGAIIAGTVSLLFVNILYSIALRSRMAAALPTRKLVYLTLFFAVSGTAAWLASRYQTALVTGLVFAGSFVIMSGLAFFKDLVRFRKSGIL